jgi:hypothetical protein
VITRREWFAISVAALLVVGACVFAFLKSSPNDVRTARLTRYCTTVYAALELDATELESGTPKRQKAAAYRFGEEVTFHSEHEIELCATAPVDLSRRDGCLIANNYACLAELAHAAARKVKP